MAIIPADEKVFMVDKRTNTTYGGSQALQDMQQWYTMQDVSDSIQPYKVFTALLTQSGADDPDTLSSGTLTKGVSYQFSGTGGTNVDFSNLGVTNPVDGEWFIATQTAAPINWDGWTVSYNIGAPVATVLENTIGNIWFTYNDIGSYLCNSSGLFTDNKIALFATPSYVNDYNIIGIQYGNTDILEINTIAVGNLTQISNNLLYNTTIEIRVYN